jgi:DNA repair protein RecO (recombination protein O)
MGAERSILHQAYILHRTPYSNSSLLLECFTAEEGRFPAIARGVKGGRHGGVAGALQPFHPLLMQATGRGEVKTLGRYESAAPPFALKGEALYCGFYLNELLMRLLGRSDPHPALFDRYHQALESLAVSEARVDHALRRFEVGMLNELGYGLLLEQEADSGVPVEPEGRYYYEPERGPVPVYGDRPSISGKTLLTLAGQEYGEEPDDEVWREARGLMRRVLARYLGDRPLKSRELFQSVTNNE